MVYRGLTWDHPRGYQALIAAADDAKGLVLSWDRQPLEGFETHPIAQLCADYDLVVLDHPHVGEAVAAGCLRPLEDLFAPEEIGAFSAATIGPCLASYHYAGRHWALPLDAATQVTAYRPDLIGAPPTTWDAVLALSETVPMALSLAGPHAALSFQSLAAAIDQSLPDADPGRFVGEEIGRQALDILARLAARAVPAAAALNPIALLALMATSDTVALCPLVYGYVNYTVPAPDARALCFADAPRHHAGGRPGSTLGGTGIGISTRCDVTPALLDHLRWLLGASAQIRFIPDHGGQPSRRDAWTDPAVNRRWGGFYEATAATLEEAYVRPRHNGAIAFQTEASALIRTTLDERRDHGATLAALQDAYTRSRIHGAER